MAFVKEMYSESRVDMIYELLKKDAGNGYRKDYEISVDELKVVSRNNDPDRFFEFEQFVLPESRNITISIHEQSHRCLRYILLLQKEAPTNEELSGTDQSFTAKIQQEKTKWAYRQLEEEYNALKQKLGECEEYAGQLQDKIDTLETEKSSSSGQLTNAIVSFAGAYINSNPNALSGIPIIGGMFGNNKKEKSSGNLAGVNSPCTCNSMPKEFTGDLTIGDDKLLQMALLPYFNPEYREKAMKVILYFFERNDFIDQAIKGIEALLQNPAKQQHTPHN